MNVVARERKENGLPVTTSEEGETQRSRKVTMMVRTMIMSMANKHIPTTVKSPPWWGFDSNDDDNDGKYDGDESWDPGRREYTFRGSDMNHYHQTDMSRTMRS